MNVVISFKFILILFEIFYDKWRVIDWFESKWVMLIIGIYKNVSSEDCLVVVMGRRNMEVF